MAKPRHHLSEKAHPLMRRLYEIITEQEMGMTRLSEKAGFSGDTLRMWFVGKRGPSLYNLEAMLNLLGYELKIVKRGEGER